MSAQKKKRVVVFSILIVGLVAVISFVRFSQATKLSRKAAATASASTAGAVGNPAASQAPLFIVEKQRFTDSIPGLVGTVKGNTIELSFNGQEERLSDVHVQVGQRVEKGKILFELDHRRAAARRSQAQSGLIRSQALLEAGGATVHDVSDAQAAFDLADKDYSDTFIRAPASGFVSQINKQVGETVGRNDIMGVLVAYEGRLVLETGVVESQLEAVSQGQTALIDIEAYPGKRLEGHVAGISREVSTTGRTGTVLIGLPMALQNKLRPGLSARCEIMTYDSPAFVIPRQAYDAEKKVVMLVGKDGAATAAPVVIGHITRDYYEVTRGLNEGDTIVSDLVTHPTEPGTQIASSGELERFKPEQAN